jgi:hypothetical protein
VDRVDLKAHPLAGDAGGVGPEEAILQVFARVELVIRAIAEEAFPVGVLLLELGDGRDPAPPAGPVHIPRHFRRHDGFEFPGLEETMGGVVAGTGAPL